MVDLVGVNVAYGENVMRHSVWTSVVFFFFPTNFQNVLNNR